MVGVCLVTTDWSVGKASLSQQDWSFTNNTKLMLWLGDGALVTFTRGKARVCARLQRQTNDGREKTGHITIFSARQVQSKRALKRTRLRYT